MPPKKRPPADAVEDPIRWPAGAVAQRVEYEAGATIFAQGSPATSVMYVLDGTVRLSVLSRNGKEAVVGVLDRWHFFGEGCLAGQPFRMTTATAIAHSVIAVVQKPDMVRLIQADRTFGEQFLSQMLLRNIRIEEDLIDQLFNSSEKRLARTLLLLARYGEPEATHRALPKVSQETLAQMVGTTRSRVNYFMNRFRKLGFIEYNGALKINNSLLSVVLRD
jgi:CRP-like cAMP-binding protein